MDNTSISSRYSHTDTTGNPTDRQAGRASGGRSVSLSPIDVTAIELLTDYLNRLADHHEDGGDTTVQQARLDRLALVLLATGRLGSGRPGGYSRSVVEDAITELLQERPDIADLLADLVNPVQPAIVGSGAVTGHDTFMSGRFVAGRDIKVEINRPPSPRKEVFHLPRDIPDL
jgi:hypothetical protein